MRARLFRAGVFGYSNGFKGGEVVFVGDATVINPGSGELLDQLEAELRRAEWRKADSKSDSKAHPKPSKPAPKATLNPVGAPHGT